MKDRSIFEVPPTGLELLVDAIVSDPEHPPPLIQVCGVPYVAVASRWVAFTDDELEAIAEALEVTFGPHVDAPTHPLSAELDAELERRQA